VQRPEPVVEKFLPIEREAGARLAHGRMARIGRRRNKGRREVARTIGHTRRRIERLARPAAIAEHIQPPFHAVGRFTSMLISGGTIRLTRQCSGAVAEAGTIAAPITDMSKS